MSPPRSPLAAKVLEIEDSLHGPQRVAEVAPRPGEWAELVRLASLDEMVDAVEAAEKRALVEAVDVLLRCMDDAAPGAFANGNTGPNGNIDEGEVLTSRCMERVRVALAPFRVERG